MDAKMSEAGQWMREQIDNGLAIPREQWGIESAPEVSMGIDDAQSILSELDRLREFERDVRGFESIVTGAGGRCIGTHHSYSAVVEAIAKLDRARATGGDGT